MNSTPDSQAAARLAAAVGQILPVDGERSLTAIAAKHDLDIALADDAEAYTGQLIVAAGESDRLDDVVRDLVTESVLYRRDAREPVDSVEYGELSAAAQALGVAVPELEEIDGATADVDGAERRTRLLGAMFALYSDMMSGPEEDRPLKLANVLGGLLRANDIDILRLPQVRAQDVRGVVRMGGIEHLLTAVWEVGDDPLAVDTSEESIQAQDRRTLIVALQGFPREMRLDPERDRRKILLDGRDLTLLLEGRWTVPHAVRWKAREQRETGVFARLPIAPPENDPTALALSSDTAEIVEVDADQKTLAANVAEFDQTISEEIEASEAEAKRLRVIGFIALAGIGRGCGRGPVHQFQDSRVDRGREPRRGQRHGHARRPSAGRRPGTARDHRPEPVLSPTTSLPAFGSKSRVCARTRLHHRPHRPRSLARELGRPRRAGVHRLSRDGGNRASRPGRRAHHQQ